jgi:hypothetical protein
MACSNRHSHVSAWPAFDRERCPKCGKAFVRKTQEAKRGRGRPRLPDIEEINKRREATGSENEVTLSAKDHFKRLQAAAR